MGCHIYRVINHCIWGMEITNHPLSFPDVTFIELLFIELEEWVSLIIGGLFHQIRCLGISVKRVYIVQDRLS